MFVPDVLGLRLDEAVACLEQHDIHYHIIPIERKNMHLPAHDRVIRQRSISKRNTVELLVAHFKPPEQGASDC